MPCPVSCLPQLHRAASPEVASFPGPPKLLSGWGGGHLPNHLSQHQLLSVDTGSQVSAHVAVQLLPRPDLGLCSSFLRCTSPGTSCTLSSASDLAAREPALWPLASVHAKSSQSCPTLCGPMDTIARQAPLSTGFSRQQYWSELPWPPPGDLRNPGIEPASLMSPTLAGRFFSTSATTPELQVVQLLSHVRLFVTLWAVARQAPLSTGFSRQASWSELPSSPSYNSSASSLSSPPGYGSSPSKQETFVIHPSLSPSAPCGLTHHSLSLLRLYCSEACSLQTICVIQIVPL